MFQILAQSWQPCIGEFTECEEKFKHTYEQYHELYFYILLNQNVTYPLQVVKWEDVHTRSSKISLDVLPFDWLVQFKSHEQEKVHLHKPARHICISSNPHFRSSSSRFNWPWNTFINWEASWLYGFTKFSENDSSVLTECQRNFFLNQTLWV